MTRGPRAAVARWSLRRRVRAAFVGLAVLFVVLSTVIVLSIVQQVRRGDDVIYRWQPAVTGSQVLISDLVNQETGIRGYALTGVQTSLQPFTEYSAQQVTDTATMRSRLAGHATLLAALDDFDTAAATWRAQVAAPLIAQVRAGSPSATSAVDTAAARATFDRVRAAAATLHAVVAAQSRHARDQRRAAMIVLDVALGVGAVLIIVAGLLLLRGVRRWVIRPVDRLAEQTRFVTEGDIHRQIAPMGPPEFLTLGTDVETMRSRITDELARIEAARQEIAQRSDELARSNADLEQFAYVASHDLSEPLRKVANFCQLLQLQYGDRLDDKARTYIEYAVDGARRMQQLINDLLSFSRVGRSSEAFVPVPLATALDAALANLDLAVSEAGAVVEHGQLPTVLGDRALLTALLQNLVGNAVKYRGAAPPRVRIDAAASAGDGWAFSVADNGIGIEPQYAERIFAIFQRLHLRDEYGGTGIGLALSRKIVEFHGGRLWLDTDAPGPGATFRFTLSEGSSGVG